MAVRKRIGNNGRLLVVLDACHSGGGSRDETDDEKLVRGSRDCFNIPVAASQIKSARNSIKWVCVSACKSYQSNYEYKADNGKKYGRLSWALSKILTVDMPANELGAAITRQYELLPAMPFPQDADIEITADLVNKPVL